MVRRKWDAPTSVHNSGEAAVIYLYFFIFGGFLKYPLVSATFTLSLGQEGTERRRRLVTVSFFHCSVVAAARRVFQSVRGEQTRCRRLLSFPHPSHFGNKNGHGE